MPAPARMRPWWLPWRPILGGFLLAFLVGVACATITRSFGDWNRGFAWERALMVRLHTPLPAALDAVAVVLPWFGTNITLIPGIIILCWWLWRTLGQRDLAIQLIVVQVGSYLLNPSLKALYARDRPSLFERRSWYSWSSFPSGHAIASVSVLVTVAIVLHRAKGWKWPYFVLLPIMVANIYTRMYFGVHWPTDVLAGALVGMVWLAATDYGFRNRRAKLAEHLGQASDVDVATADDRRDSLPLSERNRPR